MRRRRRVPVPAQKRAWCIAKPANLVHFLTGAHTSPGVIVVPQSLPIGEAIEELVLIWGASDAGEWENRILRIPLP